MAEVIDEIPCWDTWLDGRVWKLMRGKDYACTEEAMANRARCAARIRGKTVVVRSSRELGHVVVQATT